MEDLNSANRKPHKLMLTNRRTCSISGVNDVLSFDVNEIPHTAARVTVILIKCMSDSEQI